ncbi:Crp/Fnr family transcriptional regulator [Pelobium manganitolerans]|uniref:Crp/Fnr family transcriptional regulator n=1 Tax=Pelobium manganitolerans TaxID=1842495 RepID=A0A419S238_9SPHI|nr:ThuA domain-containing protein [Pelobium manganitolerans]RKD12783.1 Crp/Fnr family transcriptional regulator [Pelobium manganitolerans]
MKLFFKSTICYSLFLFIATTLCAMSKPPRILVFSKTEKFRHQSIAIGNVAIQEMGKANDFLVDTTTSAGQFTYNNLKRYAAVVFLSTTGDVLNPVQEKEFKKYINKGGGFVGVHAATDTEYDWEWYGDLVGAYFGGHPAGQVATLNVVDQSHISTMHLPKEWIRKDEWYNWKFIRKDLNVLITIDENTYKGGTNGDFHPMAWYHEFDGGRSFYTELGHTDASYKDPLFLNHLLGGIKYAAKFK